MVALRNGGPAQAVRGFALLARRDIFHRGLRIPGPPVRLARPTPKRQRSGHINSAVSVFVDFNLHHESSPNNS